MSLMVFNGSPRGKESNSTVITNWFTKNLQEANIVYLNKIKRFDDYIEASKAYDKILFVFPLYVDGMPGQVKAFFEKMYEYKDAFESKDVTYIIHSGFSESIHSKNLKKYLIRFSTLMNVNNHGVIIIPGSEGFRIMPENMTKKKAALTASLGSMFMSASPYNQSMVQKLEGIEKLNHLQTQLFKVACKLGLLNFYWNKELKKNNAYGNRFDQPYA